MLYAILCKPTKEYRMNKLFKFLASTKLALFIFLILGILLIYATLINQDKASQLIYSSIWFRVGLLFLCVNLIACTVKGFPYSMARLGVLITHAGIVVLAIGVLIGGWFGEHGAVAIEEGKVASSYVSDQKSEKIQVKIKGQLNHEMDGKILSRAVKLGPDQVVPAGTYLDHKVMHFLEENWVKSVAVKKDVQLPFSVRLDDFVLETYKIIGRFKMDEEAKPVQFALSIEEGKELNIPNSPFILKTTTHWSGSAENDLNDTFTIHNTETGQTWQYPVTIGDTIVAEEGGLEIQLHEYIPDFAFDMKERKAYTRSNKHQNPALGIGVVDRGGTEAMAPMGYWLFGRPDLAKVHEPKYKQFLFGFVRNERNNPYLELTIKDKRNLETRIDIKLPEGSQHALLEQDLGISRIDIVYLEEGGSIKDFKSYLTVLEDDDEVDTKVIEVNDPLKYGGYSFFQQSYDSQAGKYTVLGVVRDPGVPVVFAGFILASAGMIYCAYVRPALKRKRRPKKSVEETAEDTADA